jgi:hypothetical protein
MSNHPDTIIHSYWFDKSKHLKNIPQPACISVDVPNVISNTLPNIFIQVEPNIISNNEQYLINNYKKYHTIFTFNKTLLEKCPNAKYYIYGTTWIEKTYYDNIKIDIKQFKISTLASTKYLNNAPGHIFRQTIHHNQHILKKYPITFFRSFAQIPHIHDYGNNPFLGIKNSLTTPHCKVELFEEFQFAIVIENSKQTNYFTEKIMDCILTKTIPIYWGCPNISDFFDTTGWIILESISINELYEKLAILNEKYYNQYTYIIEKNFITAQKYVDFYENINNAK